MRFFIYTCIIWVLFSPTGIFAETIVGNTIINKKTVWTKQHSPYVIEGNILIQNFLLIEPGVVVTFKNGNIFVQNGTLSLLGTESNPIKINTTQTGSVLFSGVKSDLNFDHVEIDDMYSRRFVEVWHESTVNINNITHQAFGGDGSWISGFDRSIVDVNTLELSGWQGAGIEVFDHSSSTIQESIFENIRKAIYTYNLSKLKVEQTVFEDNTIGVDAFTSNVYLHENDFEDNRIAFRYDTEYAAAEAKDNWWGSFSGPIMKTEDSRDQNTISGNIITHPWSLERHRGKNIICCSNIVFLPGLMGSRLYMQNGQFEDQLWEPNRNVDVENLFLDAAGTSRQSNIYTRDIIDKTNIVGGLSLVEQTPYKDFSEFMDKLVKNKTINAWKKAPYDWRFMPDSILEYGMAVGQKGNIKIERLVGVIIHMAADSKTKKVTIVTHSNGGLVAKELMIDLENRGLSHLVDRVIAVGMPEFGTPQAITSLLFGHEQTIAGGLILRAKVAKGLGQNMPTAYTLLPSEKYFEGRDMAEVLQIATTTVYSSDDLLKTLSAYGQINKHLFNNAKDWHDKRDGWKPNMDMYQIVGTGLPTVSGLQKIKNKDVPTYTKTGDGIVQDMFLKSQGKFNRTGKIKVVDLSNTSYKHMNLMNAPSVLTYIDQILRNKPTSTSTDIVTKIHNDAFYYEIAQVTVPEKTIAPITLSHIDSKYIQTNTKSFDKVEGEDRYESFGSTIQFLNDTLDKLKLISQGNKKVEIDIFKSGPTLEYISFGEIHIGGGQELFVNGSNNPVVYTEQVSFVPESMVEVNRVGSVIREEFVASSTETIEERIVKVKSKIQQSSISPYLKESYVRKLGVFEKDKNNIYLKSLIERLQRAIANIDRYNYSIRLRSQYAKTRKDYLVLLSLFKYLDVENAGNMRLL